MTLLDRVTLVLTDAAIPHALIGASALSAAGVARSTFDIDLLVMDRRVLRVEVWESLRGAGMLIDIRIGDADDPLAGVVRIESAQERPIDVIVGRAAWQQRAIERATVGVQSPPVVQPVDLVLLKLYAGGTQDLWDVRELLRVSGGALSEAVERDLAGLPEMMQTAWSQVREETR